MTQRNTDSKDHLDSAKLWVAEQPEGSLDATRGVVTSLKRAKVL
eukprot:gene21441-27473_t